MDIHLKVQYVINIVVCIQRTSTFQTELAAKRMANIRNIGNCLLGLVLIFMWSKN